MSKIKIGTLYDNNTKRNKHGYVNFVCVSNNENTYSFYVIEECRYFTYQDCDTEEAVKDGHWIILHVPET